MGTEETTPTRRWRPQFSLRTLLLGVFFVSACGGLWWRWEPWVPDGNQLIMGCGQDVRIWLRRRPEYWWGIAWLPEFWIAYFSSGALLVIAARNLRRPKASATAALPA